MTEKAIQDFYADDIAICYGCGRHNPHGLHIKSYWDGREAVCHFKPRAHHTAFPGVVYGGLIASVIDCHCIATAHAAAYQAEGRELGTEPEMTFVTGTLKVTYLHATPIEAELSLRAGIKELHEKKIVITCSVFADGKANRTGGNDCHPRTAGYETVIKSVNQGLNDPAPPVLFVMAGGPGF